MFDWPFDFLALLIAIVALLIARKALNRVDELRRQLEVMQSFAAAAPPRAAPPPIPPAMEPEKAPPLVAEPPISVSPSQATMPAPEPGLSGSGESNVPAAPPPLPSPPPADPGFEER